MININELSQYFPDVNNPVTEGDYTFLISILQEHHNEIFVLNLKIQQRDRKENHLIKFRIGLGKHRKFDQATHETNKPHFEIDFFKREKESFSATIYFTFNEISDDELMDYAKGTVLMIAKLLRHFCKNHKLSCDFIDKVIYEDEVFEELSKYENYLIDAFYQCYLKKDLVVRNESGERVLIKNAYQLEKFFNHKDLEPLFLPLKRRVSLN